MSNEYRRRGLEEWMHAIRNSKLALPEFQRPYRWDPKKTRRLLDSVFRRRPIGVVLLLEQARKEDLLFRSRTLLDAPPEQDGVEKELVLDGQQRLTSLWRSLDNEAILGRIEAGSGTGEQRYYVEYDRVVDDDRFHGEQFVYRAIKGVSLSKPLSPQSANVKNLVPVDLVGFDDITQRRGALREWCDEACANDAKKASDMESKLRSMARPLADGALFFCHLDRDVDRRTCVEIFRAVNESALKLRVVDVAVAEIRPNASALSLRERIKSWVTRDARHAIKWFYPEASEKAIQQLSESIFKIACVAENLVPTEGKYLNDKVIRYVEDHLDDILYGLTESYTFLQQQSIWRPDLMPYGSPLRVLPNLFVKVRALKGGKMGMAQSVLKSYLWQSFLSDRYARATNQAILNDYRALSRILDTIVAGGEPESFRMPSNTRFPDWKSIHRLDGDLAGVTAQSSIGRAFLALSLSGGALDFSTGKPIDAQQSEKLHRHHLFPRAFLERILIKLPEPERNRAIDHGLNFSFIEGSTNSELGGAAPRRYLQQRLEDDPTLNSDVLKRRVESHVVPFDYLNVDEATGRKGYEKFLEKRASWLCEIIEERIGFSVRDNAPQYR